MVISLVRMVRRGLIRRHNAIISFWLVGLVVAWLVCAITFFKVKVMDEKLTAKIQAYLDAAPEDKNVIEGATMLLSLNRNRIFFQNVVRKPEKFADKVEYELKKHLAIRLDRKTIADVATMNKVVIPAAQATIAEGAPVISTDNDLPTEGTVVRGKRADHELLPDEIKALWDECTPLWFKIKELFELLKRWRVLRPVTALNTYSSWKSVTKSIVPICRLMMLLLLVLLMLIRIMARKRKIIRLILLKKSMLHGNIFLTIKRSWLI